MRDVLTGQEIDPHRRVSGGHWGGQRVKDMHDLRIPVDERYHCRERLQDWSGEADGVNVEVYFRNLEEELCIKIGRADVVVGAVAWLTNYEILKSLSRVKGGVSLIVQKEDFLRPDLGADKKTFNRKLRSAYDRLHPPPGRLYWPTLSSLTVGYDPSFQPVRCVGNHNRDRRPAFPRMHNKFLVFCRHDSPSGYPEPYAVWTGSFNFTKNGTASFENAVYITSPEIGDMYLREWAQIAALSEPLSWDSDWCAPEWRVGT